METAITGYDIHQKYIDDAHTFALASDRGSEFVGGAICDYGLIVHVVPVPDGPMTALSTSKSSYSR